MRCFALVLVAACGGGGGFPVDAPPEGPPVGGKFSVAWTLQDTNNQPITCGQVGGSLITVTLRNRDVQGGFVEVFGCTSGMATSLLSFTPGTYDISFQLNGMVGNGMTGELALAAPAIGVEIEANETT